MGLTHLLDTDTCIYAINRRSETLLANLRDAVASTAMSSITFAELSFGAEKSRHVAENLMTILNFSRLINVVDFDSAAALHYGQIKSHLMKAGTPIGPYDLLIAAHARSLGLTLVTNNRREFDRVPGLAIENWLGEP